MPIDNERKSKVIDRTTTSLPVIEDQIMVGKEVIDKSTLHVRKQVHEEEVIVDARSTSDFVTIDRVAINQPIQSAPPPVRYEGDKMIISVVKEELVIEKKLILVEELHVTRQVIQKQEKIPVTLKKEQIIIDEEKHNITRGDDSERKRPG